VQHAGGASSSFVRRTAQRAGAAGGRRSRDERAYSSLTRRLPSGASAASGMCVRTQATETDHGDSEQQREEA
jgi:hypothetical protein